MLRERIKRKAHEVVYSTGTCDPIKICEAKHIPVYHDDLGKQIMAYHTVIKRIPAIVLSTRNSEFEDNYSCGHELGHHFCRHTGNTECLKRNNLRFSAMGNEAEANEFMVDLMLDGVNPRDYETKEQLLKTHGVPAWAEKYVDWKAMLQSTTSKRDRR